MVAVLRDGRGVRGVPRGGPQGDWSAPRACGNEAELDYWHRDSGTWPAERPHPVFRKWFEVRLHPLIQDLVGEELTATEVDEEFIGELRTALEGVEPRS